MKPIKKQGAKLILILGILVGALILTIVCIRSDDFLLKNLGICLWACVSFGVLIAALRDYRKKERLLICIQELLEGQEEEEILQQYREGFFNCKEEAVIRQLCNYFQETSLAEILKNEAEIHALQNQINPHFLYNTLDVIRSRAMRQGNEDVAEMVAALGLQFRYCINRFGEMATLQQELDHVRNYLLIQKYRMGDRYRFDTIIPDEEVLPCRLPVLTLQPIIENSLNHGISSMVKGGIIILKVYLKGGRVEITIEDNGVGMSGKELQTVRESLHQSDEILTKVAGKASQGIALKNVNKRIKFYYGEEYGLDITSTPGVGTSVFVTIPFLLE